MDVTVFDWISLYHPQQTSDCSVAAQCKSNHSYLNIQTRFPQNALGRLWTQRTELMQAHIALVPKVLMHWLDECKRQEKQDAAMQEA